MSKQRSRRRTTEKAKARQLTLEPLEPRHLFATAIFKNGILNINGTNFVDRIDVQQNAGFISTGTPIRFGTTFVQSVPANSVQHIIVKARRGNDIVSLTNGSEQVSVIIMAYLGDGNDEYSGGAGTDFVYAGDGVDKVHGNSGNDKIFGEDGNDELHGYAGLDQLDGGAGIDIIGGGQDRDEISGGSEGDFIYGQEGNDLIHGGSGDDTIYGGDNNDEIYGEADGDSALIGGDGNDFISGGQGNDKINGGEGNDTLRGDEHDDRIDGYAGVDTIFGDDGNDVIGGGLDRDLIFGGMDNDLLFGHEGNDEIHGGIGNDTLHGNEDADALHGYEGNDVIYGGIGDDVLGGGSGNDILFGEDGIDNLNGHEGMDFLWPGLDGAKDIAYGDLAGSHFPDWFFTLANTTSVMDRGSRDVEIRLLGFGPQWTNEETKALSPAFEILANATGNTAFGRDIFAEQITLIRQDFSGASQVVMFGSTLRISKGAFDSQLVETVISTLLEPRQNMNGFESQFRELSKWTSTDPADAKFIMTEKYGQRNWYHKDSLFVSEPATTHPLDDFIESSLAALGVGRRLSAAAPAKVDLVFQWLGSLAEAF